MPSAQSGSGAEAMPQDRRMTQQRALRRTPRTSSPGLPLALRARGVGASALCEVRIRRGGYATAAQGPSIDAIHRPVRLESPGPVAQLGERCVRNAEVVSSILIRSTTKPPEVRGFVFLRWKRLPETARRGTGVMGPGWSRVGGYDQAQCLRGRLGATQRLDHTIVGSGGGGRSGEDAGSRKCQSRG